MPEPIEAEAQNGSDRNAKRGREFASVCVFKQAGKDVKEPTKGAHTFAMRKGQSFLGDPIKAIDALKAAFPGCTFSWEKS